MSGRARLEVVEGLLELLEGVRRAVLPATGERESRVQTLPGRDLGFYAHGVRRRNDAAGCASPLTREGTRREKRDERVVGKGRELSKAGTSQNRRRAQAIFRIRLDDARERRVAARERNEP